MSDYKLEQFLGSVFDSCDTAKSGSVPAGVLRGITQNLLAGDSDDAKALLSGENPITRSDYISTMKRAIVREIGGVFSSYDSDEDGVLSESELGAVLTDLSSAQAASAVIAQYDAAKVGGLDRQSFLAFFIDNLVAQGGISSGSGGSGSSSSGGGGVSPAAVASVKAALGLSDAEAEDYRRMFSECDADGDGLLKVGDIERALTRRSEGGRGLIDPSRLLNYLDENWSSAVEFDEFVRGSLKIKRASNGAVNLAALLSAASVAGVAAQLKGLAAIVMGSGRDDAAATAAAAAVAGGGAADVGAGGVPAGSMGLSSRRGNGGAAGGLGGMGAGNEEVSKLNEEVHSLTMAKAVAEERLAAFQKDYNDLSAKHKALQKKFNDAGIENKTLAEKVKKLESGVRDYAAKVKELQDRLSEAQVNIQVLKGKLAPAAAAASTESSSSSAAGAGAAAASAGTSAVGGSEAAFFGEKKDEKKLAQELKERNEELEREVAGLRDMLEQAKAAAEEEQDLAKTRAILGGTERINAGSAAALLDRIARLEKECEDLRKANAAAVRGNNDLRKYAKLAEDLKAQTDIANNFSKEITNLRAQVMVLRSQASSSSSSSSSSVDAAAVAAGSTGTENRDFAASLESTKVYVTLERILAGEQVPLAPQEPSVLVTARRAMKALTDLRADAALARKELAEIVPATGSTQSLREAAEAARKEFKTAQAAAAAAAAADASASGNEDELRRLRSENAALAKQIEIMSASDRQDNINTPLLESFHSIVKRRTPANNRYMIMIIIAAVVGLVVGCLLIFFILSGVCGSMNFRKCNN